MANNVKAVETIKGIQLDTIFLELQSRKFKCFLPINLTKLNLFYSQFYARSIGTKGGRNSGLAFLFETHDNLIYAVTIKRHKAPNYSQWDFDCIVPLPNDFLTDDDSKVERSKLVLGLLNTLELNFALSFGTQNPMRYFFAFDMLEQEYFTKEIGKDELYFVIKNTVVDNYTSNRSFHAFGMEGIYAFDVDEHVDNRHYDFESFAYEYLSYPETFEKTIDKILNELSLNAARSPF